MSGNTYRIYINQIVLLITENPQAALPPHQHIDITSFDFGAFYEQMKREPGPILFVAETVNAKRFFKKIKNSSTFIKAAGGVVRNEENMFLFIFRNGKWDLPKGKLDADEKPRKAAVREVEEECGIRISKLGDKLCNTYHVYQENGSLILKKTSWYKMVAEGQTSLIPQIEEGITDARWVATTDFGMIRSNTYPLIADVLTLIVSD
ncbi:MAG TPA: NUDIX domain-containing protein [Sphingobacteriaceae bacterium]